MAMSHRTNVLMWHQQASDNRKYSEGNQTLVPTVVTSKHAPRRGGGVFWQPSNGPLTPPSE